MPRSGNGGEMCSADAYGISGDRTVLAGPAWACASWFAAESRGASGNGRSTDASARHRSPCLPATNGSAYEAGLACRGCESDPEGPERARYRWPGPATAESAGGLRSHRRPYGSWWSNRLDCAPAHGLRVLLAPLFPGTRRGSGCTYCCRIDHPSVQIDQAFLIQANVRTLKNLIERAVIPPVTEACDTPLTMARTARGGHARRRLNTRPRGCH